MCAGESLVELSSSHLNFYRGCDKKIHSLFNRDGVAEQQDTVASFLQMLFFTALESIGAYKLCATVALSTSFNLLHYKKIQLIWGICYMIFHLPDFIIFLVSVSSGHQTEVSPALFLPTFLHSSLSFYYSFFQCIFIFSSSPSQKYSFSHPHLPVMTPIARAIPFSLYLRRHSLYVLLYHSSFVTEKGNTSSSNFFDPSQLVNPLEFCPYLAF